MTNGRNRTLYPRYQWLRQSQLLQLRLLRNIELRHRLQNTNHPQLTWVTDNAAPLFVTAVGRLVICGETVACLKLAYHRCGMLKVKLNPRPTACIVIRVGISLTTAKLRPQEGPALTAVDDTGNSIAHAMSGMLRPLMIHKHLQPIRETKGHSWQCWVPWVRVYCQRSPNFFFFFETMYLTPL